MMKKPSPSTLFGLLVLVVGGGFFLLKFNPKPDPGFSPQPSFEQITVSPRTSNPNSMASFSPEGTPVLSASDRARLEVLDQILISKNDNDPRLDSDFKNLSDPMKEALRKKYRSAPPEDRNGRGTYVFLLGREIQTMAELDFFREVLQETPCLSLADCSKAPPNDSHSDPALESANATTLAYPQKMARAMLDRKLHSDETSAELKKAIEPLTR